ncbi:hypothetical protein GCM10027061_13620 [Nesterenkonia suensis]
MASLESLESLESLVSLESIGPVYVRAPGEGGPRGAGQFTDSSSNSCDVVTCLDGSRHLVSLTWLRARAMLGGAVVVTSSADGQRQSTMRHDHL